MLFFMSKREVFVGVKIRPVVEFARTLYLYCPLAEIVAIVTLHRETVKVHTVRFSTSKQRRYCSPIFALTDEDNVPVQFADFL